MFIILLIRLWRSWQDADKAAEPPKPNTPQIIWMVEVSRLINAMLLTSSTKLSVLPHLIFFLFFLPPAS